MLKTLKETVKKLPGIRKLILERNALQTEIADLQAKLLIYTQNSHFVPPGHYYSPIPNLAEIQRDEAKIFSNPKTQIAGIDLNEDKQLRLLNEFIPFYKEVPFQDHKTENLRYYFENPAYSYSDAIFLHCMIRHTSPKQIIEVGSGFSSCVTLDTSELFFGGNIQTTFIEPYPQLLKSLVKPEDEDRIEVISSRLQDIDLTFFDRLKANDILFIDSTHVSKIDSDVNYLFFEILPRLSAGVYIHFHDIFFPFEYPKAWIYEGRAWNEAYLLRSFLQYNNTFGIILMNTFMEYFHSSFFEEHMPLCLKNPGGSIWLRKN